MEAVIVSSNSADDNTVVMLMRYRIRVEVLSAA
jgi:hypothetical protein